ncbi:MAG: COX15/CtaA family protein [Verrucomicrobiales bacterium]|jgi:cytochrome c oxidase assembly protein subunit 15|nr:COX15/CtaA family protein [Verrucomicrobiales bacterium]
MSTVAEPNRRIAIWLFVIALAIYAMVIVGGATRLTGSGLSITVWDPIIGALPPFSQQAWQQAFDLYQQSPQYKITNAGMSLDEFKGIFYWEYFHRLLGRAIGVIFFFPFLYFLFTKQISRKFVPHLVAIFLLGGLQGALGWFMVKSGLVDKPWVSPYRLTAHLLTALFLYAYVLWQAFRLWGVGDTNQDKVACNLKGWSLVLLGLLVVQISYGGFVAGLHAAMTYPTFPTMNGQWIPEGLLRQVPLWSNFFENHTTTQFIHRGLAFLLVISVALYWRRSAGVKRLVFGRNLLLAAVLLQFLLGVLTIVNSAGHVPVTLGVLHQAGAVALLSVLLYLIYLSGPRTAAAEA